MRSFMKYCCHIWTLTPGYCLDMSDKLQSQVYRTVGSSIAALPGQKTHCGNGNFFIGNKFIDIHLN